MKKRIHIHDYRIVQPYTLKGKFIVLVLQFLYALAGVFMRRKWAKPLSDFEENPATYTFEHIAYLGYKYYIQPPTEFDEKIVRYFDEQNLDFSPPESFNETSRITLSAGGDLMPYELISKKNCSKLWDEVGEWFFNSDIVFANLETPMCLTKPRSHVPEIMLYNMLFNGDEELWEIYSGNGKYKGYDIVSTANNHSYDMGIEGVEQTIAFLQSKKVAYTGTNSRESKERHIPILKRNGIRVAFLSYTYSLNHLQVEEEYAHCIHHLPLNQRGVDLSDIKEDVIIARKKGVDIIVMALHTGNAYQSLPSEHTIENYHRIFEECGVDIILGSHPHNPQPMEQHAFACPFTGEKKKGFAIYSLADFVAYDIFVLDRLLPLLKLHISKGTLHGETKTILTHVECKPVFNWCNGTNSEIKFYDLFQLMAGEFPKEFSKRDQQEASFLYAYAKTYLVNEQRKHLLQGA